MQHLSRLGLFIRQIAFHIWAKKHLRCWILIPALLFVVACDPLAPDPTRIVIVLTATPTRTPAPTRTPLPTETPTPEPPTEAPTATPWLCNEKTGQVVDLTFD